MVKQMLYILHRDRAYRAKSGQPPIVRHCRLQHVTAALVRCPKQHGTHRAAFQRGLQPDRGGNVRQETPAGGLLPRHKILFYDLPNLLLRLDVYKAFLITHCVTLLHKKQHLSFQTGTAFTSRKAILRPFLFFCFSVFVSVHIQETACNGTSQNLLRTLSGPERPSFQCKPGATPA